VDYTDFMNNVLVNFMLQMKSFNAKTQIRQEKKGKNKPKLVKKSE
jgi:hypothetical protein